MPEMHSGRKEDLHEYNNYTKQRVADLESDIKERFRITRDSITSPFSRLWIITYDYEKLHKNLQAVQNDADGLTSTCIQLIINRIEKRRDLFAELLPKFKEHIDKLYEKINKYVGIFLPANVFMLPICSYVAYSFFT